MLILFSKLHNRGKKKKRLLCHLKHLPLSPVNAAHVIISYVGRKLMAFILMPAGSVYVVLMFISYIYINSSKYLYSFTSNAAAL